jgi:hypothetical protein
LSRSVALAGEKFRSSKEMTKHECRMTKEAESPNDQKARL